MAERQTHSEGPQTVTIRDVASACRVSPGTVSRVLRGRLGVMQVPPSTRYRIEETARRLGYTPNIHAKRVFSRRAGVLGFVVPSFGKLGTHVFDNLHLTRLLTGMESELTGRGERLLLIWNDDRFVSEKHYLSLFRERSVDGLFIWGAEEAASYWKEMTGQGWPHLFLGNLPAGDPKANFLLNDDEGAGFAVAGELIRRGARRLAWVGGKAGVSVSQLQISGIRRAMEEAGLDGRSLAIAYGDFQESSAAEAVRKMLASPIPMDGLVCANGNAARGALAILRPAHAGIALGVCDACAGIERNRDFLRVEPRDVEIGKAAVRSLLELVEGRTASVRRHLGFDLILESSTGAHERPDGLEEAEARS